MNNHQSYPGDTIDIGSDAVVVPCDFNAVSDSAFIASLKPISDDLQAAHIHLQHDEIEPAKKCVINHFITRSKPLYHFDNRDAAGPKVYLTLDLVFADDSVVAAADDVLENRFHAWFNPDIIYDMGTPIDWTIGKNSEIIGIEAATARNHFLITLMLAWLQTHDDRYAAKFEALCRSYNEHKPMVMTGNPIPHIDCFFDHDARQHYCMNVGFRLMDYLDCLYSGVFTSPAFPDAFRFYFLKHIWFHGMQFHRMRHLEEMFEPQNHHHYEWGVVPFLIGVLFPEWPAAETMWRYGRAAIREHVDREIFADGAPVEHSSAYMGRIYWYYGCSLDLARRNHIELLTADQEERIRKYGELTIHLRQPDGLQTSFGDGQMGEIWFDALNAVMLFPTAANRNALESVGFDADKVTSGAGVPSYRPELFKEITGSGLPPTAAVYPDGGIALLRSHWGRDANFVFLSMNSKSMKSHDHAEPLSINLCVGGRTLVTVPADGLYGHMDVDTDERWPYMYGMESHNSVIIDDGLFTPLRTWSAFAPKCRLVSSQSDDDSDVVEAEYQVSGITHNRRIEFTKLSGLTVIDRFTGIPASELHGYTVLYHFDWGVDLNEDKEGFVLSADDVNCRLCIEGPGAAESQITQDDKLAAIARQRPLPFVLTTTFQCKGETTIKSQFRWA